MPKQFPQAEVYTKDEIDALLLKKADAVDLAALDAALADMEDRLIILEGGIVVPPPPPPLVLNFEEPPISTGNIARIGATEYPTLQAAHNALSLAGGAIEVLPGTHVGSKILLATDRPIQLVGVRDAQGRMPWLNGQGMSVNKGIINCRQAITGNDVGFANVVNSSGNAAGIRPEPTCLSITLNRCGFRTLQNGILTNTDSAINEVMTWTDCLFDGCGNDGFSHGVYIGYALKATLLRCKFINGAGGNDIKSRAWETILQDCEVIQTNNTSRAVDISNGGKLRILGGRYFKPSTNGMGQLIGIWQEDTSGAGLDGRTHDYRIEGATLENRRSPGSLVANNKFGINVPCFVVGCTLLGTTTMEGNVVVS